MGTIAQLFEDNKDSMLPHTTSEMFSYWGYFSQFQTHLTNTFVLCCKDKSNFSTDSDNAIYWFE